MVAIECIKAGANVLVEKPIADSVENAQAIIDAAKENGKIVMVGHIERFNPAVDVVNHVFELASSEW